MVSIYYKPTKKSAVNGKRIVTYFALLFLKVEKVENKRFN